MNQRFLILVLSVVVLLAHVHCEVYAQQNENLEPENGLFVGRGSEPYYRALATALLDDHDYRNCQMLVIPLYSPESAVYITNTKWYETPKVISIEMEHQLWASIVKVQLESNHGKLSGSTAEDQQKTLDKINKTTIRWERDIDQNSSRALAGIWREMLNRVQYERIEIKPQINLGIGGNINISATGGSIELAGITYHVAHHEIGFGYRAGKITSPHKGSVLAEFVELGEALQGFAKKEVEVDALSKKIEHFQQRLQEKKP
jgi:hypothetical protein